MQRESAREVRGGSRGVGSRQHEAHHDLAVLVDLPRRFESESPVEARGALVFGDVAEVDGVARRVARERDVVATAQIFAGAAVYFAWIGALAALAWRWSGTEAALIAGFALPGLAVAALVAIERETAVVDAIRAWYLLGRSRGATRERLRRRRSEIADVLDEVYRWMQEGAAS